MGRSGRVWVAALAMGFCMLLAAPLAAQGEPESSGAGGQQAAEAGGAGQEPTDAERKVAREAYAEGQEKYAEGEYEAAEEAFQRAYDAVPEPVVLLGIGKARQKRGDVAGAIEMFEQYLEGRPDAPDREEVEERLEKLRNRPGSVSVDSRPTGARISMDGEPTGQHTPADFELEPGRYTVAVSQQGFETRTQTIEVEPGVQRELNLKLRTEAAPDEEEVFGAGEGIDGAPSDADGSEDGDDDQPSAGVWVSAGVAAGGLVAGTVLGFMALSEQSEFEDMPTEATADRGERLALFADVAFGVAAAAAVTGLVLHLTSDGSPQTEHASGADDDTRVEVDVAPAVSTEGAGVDARVRF